MVDRIKQLIEFKGLTPAAFANEVEINRSGLTHIFSGRNQPSLDLIRKILLTFPDISTEWLMLGKGNMLRELKDTSGLEKIEEDQNSKRFVQTDLFTPPELLENPVLPIQNEEVIKSVSVAQTATAENEEEITNKKRGVIGKSSRNRANIADDFPDRRKKINSQEDKKIEKVVFFYADNTFETYYPSK